VDYPSLRTLTIREVEEFQYIKEETSEGEFQNKAILWSLWMHGELLLVRRALHVKEAPFEPN